MSTKHRFHLRKFFPFFIAIAVDAIGFVIISPLLPSLMKDLGTSGLEQHFLYGFILSLYSVSYMFAAPILGAVSDFWGRRKTLISCAIVQLFSFSCYAISFYKMDLYWLLFARVLGGLSSGSQCIAQAAVTDLSTHAERPINIGLMAIAMTAGLVFGPLFASFPLVPHGGWSNLELAFMGVILLSLFNLLLLAFSLHETRVPNHSIVERKWKHQFHHFLKLFTHDKTQKHLILFLFFELGWSLYYQSLAIELTEDLHLGQRAIACFLCLVGISLCFSLFFLVRFAARIGHANQIIQFSLVVSGLSLILDAYLDSIAWQIAFAVIVTACVALCYTNIISELSRHVHKDSQGLLMGTTDALLALAFSITGLLSGYLTYLSPTLPLLVAGIINIAGVVGYWGKSKLVEEH